MAAIILPFNDAFIFRMTDDTGIFHHCVNGVPDPREGYTTDDNARALIMAALLYQQFPEEKYRNLLYRYLSFLLYAQNTDGWFKNFMGYDRRFIEDKGSEDCYGRCLWALGYTASNEFLPQDLRRTAQKVFEDALPNCEKLSFPRAKAYAIIGLSYLPTNKTKNKMIPLLDSLLKQHDHSSTPDWKWFEDYMSYSNAVLPWAMLAGYKTVKIERYKEVGLESLGFLESKTFTHGYFKPIGCKGWYFKEKKAAEFDEQPLEAAETLLCYLEAYELTQEKKYLEKALKCYKWYEGDNSKRIPVIDAETGGCYDGITKEGVNLNQGAESIISYMLARLSIQKYI